jgi:polyisoprenoid-binding protein YceI
MRAVIAIFIITLPIRIFGQAFIPEKSGSLVGFTIKNFGLTVEGSFNGIGGTITFDADDLINSRFNIILDASTIDTGIGLRNKHLRGKDYFDVESNPEIRFVSSSVAEKDGRFLVTGNLTIKGTSRQISFPFVALPLEKGIKFVGEFAINRKSFNVGGNSPGMGDHVVVKLSVIARTHSGN